MRPRSVRAAARTRSKSARSSSTEYVRADFLPPEGAARVRELLRRYVDQRVAFYLSRDEGHIDQINADTEKLQAELWSATLLHCMNQTSGTPVVSLRCEGADAIGAKRTCRERRERVDLTLLTRSGPRSELKVGLVRASLLAQGSRGELETTRQADVPGAPTGPGSRSPRSRDRRTEPRTALPWRRVIRTPAICRARAAGRSSPHSAGAGRQPIRMIGLNGSRPSRQMRG